MFIRLKKYIDLIELAKTGELAATFHRVNENRAQAELVEVRKEVKRLTNVIIHLKEQGQVLPPGAGDPFWGRYSQLDEEAAANGPQEVAEPPSAEDREAEIGTAEFDVQLQAALEAEDSH